MIVTEPDPFWEYAGNDNVLVIPITKFVKKDGTLAMVDTLAKEAVEKHPYLPTRWGYAIRNGIEFPVFRSEGINLLGAPVKDHYAANDSPELIEAALWYIRDLAFSDVDNLYYLPLLGGRDYLELHKKVLDNATVYSNIIVLAEGVDPHDWED